VWVTGSMPVVCSSNRRGGWPAAGRPGKGNRCPCRRRGRRSALGGASHASHRTRGAETIHPTVVQSMARQIPALPDTAEHPERDLQVAEPPGELWRNVRLAPSVCCCGVNAALQAHSQSGAVSRCAQPCLCSNKPVDNGLHGSQSSLHTNRATNIPTDFRSLES
jgi:hypothetical protein